MADRDDKPRAHSIERAKSARSSCQSCGKPIVDGGLRLSEAFVSDEGKWARSHSRARTTKSRGDGFDDDRRGHDSQNPDVWARFHHLECAAKHEPYKLKYALAACTIELPDREGLEQAIEATLSVVDPAEDNAETREEYQQFMTRLREAPDDELALVFGDWLQRVGDPRGELVSVQTALETATGEEKVRISDLEKKLLAQHRKQLMPDRLEGACTWRRGFVHRLTLKGLEPESLVRAFAHPSFRLLRELIVTIDSYTLVIAANLPVPLPETLRVLELGGSSGSGSTMIGAVGPLLDKSVPQLERLKLAGAADLEGLRHPALAELELVCSDGAADTASTSRGDPRSLSVRVAALERRKLPALVRLRVHVDRGLDSVVAGLAATRVLGKLHTLVLRGDLTASGVACLKDVKLKIDVLDVRGTTLTSAADAVLMKKLAAEIVTHDPVAVAVKPAEQVGEWLVRHTRRPEWGIGRVVEEADEGLTVEFEHAGSKQVKNLELLEEVKPS